MDIHQIDLRPDLAKVGIDIRVVGNDAGEKLSILAGSISRINRNAPHYGELTYNDFNTFYLQAASSTSGGSSGSPVLNIDGHAVALQAGGRTEAATDFFLPLDRVKRALSFVQKSLTVPRGTIQTRFVHRPFDEARRLGLSSEFEDQIRRSYPDEIGTLVVEQVLPKGPAHGLIRESDILISINGNLVTKFVDLEEILDSSIDGTITVVVDRGGKPHTVEVNIQDLHSITPNRLLEVGGAQLNDLSYQLACHYGQPVEGVYVSSASGIFKLGNSGLGAIITSVDDHPTPNLDTFIEVMKSIPDCKRFPVVYHSIADVHTTDWILTVMDRHWSSMTLYTRNDTTGIWDSKKVGEYVEPLPLVPKTASFVDIETHSVPAQVLKHSVVRISYFTPVKIDGFPRSRTRGGGIILDAEKGLVVTSRNVIPFDIGDIYITFAESIVIPGKVEFLHPSYNFAILSYDPKFIGETPVKTPKISETRLSQGNSVYLVGFNQNFRVFATKTVVSDITNVTIPEDATPRFRSINLDTITLDTPLAHSSSTGILSDEEGNIQGLWLTFLGEKSSNHYDNEYHMGIHISTVLPALKSLQEGKFPLLYSLNVELSFVNLVQARHLELPEEWIARIENTGATERAVYQVRRTEVGSQSSQVLQTLDLILTLNGKILSKMSDIDELSHLPELDITILRGKKILDLKVKQDLVQGNGTDRIVVWAGTIIQAPHKAVLQQSTTLPSRVYISGKSTGGPGYHYGLVSSCYIF
jgi:S1-C subfamily serine protease